MPLLEAVVAGDETAFVIFKALIVSSDDTIKGHSSVDWTKGQRAITGRLAGRPVKASKFMCIQADLAISSCECRPARLDIPAALQGEFELTPVKTIRERPSWSSWTLVQPGRLSSFESSRARRLGRGGGGCRLARIHGAATTMDALEPSNFCRQNAFVDWTVVQYANSSNGGH